MIRHFTAQCKLLLNSLIDEDLFYEATKEFSHYNEPCPRCGASGKLSRYGDYSRWLVFKIDESAFSRRIRPLRFKCASCDATHALLPDILVPYSPYSLRFKLSALIAYYERNTTVVAVCEQLGIAVSTIYAWKELFLSHKDLMLGLLASGKEPALAFLRRLFGANNCLSDRLRSFFRRYAFSFMQNRSTSATQSNSP